MTDTQTRTCSVAGCDGLHSARGWCATHYMRWYTHGDPLYVASPRFPANPWAGRVVCPCCGTDAWTLPYGPGGPDWHCVECGAWFAIPLAPDA